MRDRENLCPGLPAPIVSALHQHYAAQWEKGGRVHWWRHDWGSNNIKCKFCGVIAQPEPGEFYDLY